ncbi:MAG: hypothetical protein MZU95_03895 [Desulfomicrobium escambiense]|nr:hypothetical protein [Desulfomicrobium escambiense]
MPDFVRGILLPPAHRQGAPRAIQRGLIGSSACLHGRGRRLDPQAWTRSTGPRQAARQYREIFGEGNYFLEMHGATGFPSNPSSIRQLMELAQELSIPLVATNDCHYLARGPTARPMTCSCASRRARPWTDTDRMRLRNRRLLSQVPRRDDSSCSATCPEAIDRTRSRIAGASCQARLQLGRPPAALPEIRPGAISR